MPRAASSPNHARGWSVLAVVTLVPVVYPVPIVVLEGGERPEDIVTHQVLVHGSLARGRGIDQRAAAPEPAVQIELDRHRGRRPGWDPHRRGEPQFLPDAEIARVGEIGAVERGRSTTADSRDNGW